MVGFGALEEVPSHGPSPHTHGGDAREHCTMSNLTKLRRLAAGLRGGWCSCCEVRMIGDQEWAPIVKISREEVNADGCKNEWMAVCLQTRGVFTINQVIL